AMDDRVRPKTLAFVLLGVKGKDDARVATQVLELALSEVDEGRHDELSVVQPCPGERDVRCAVRIERDDVDERSGSQELSDRCRDRHHAPKSDAAASGRQPLLAQQSTGGASG